jgi:hypothetical protein
MPARQSFCPGGFYVLPEWQPCRLPMGLPVMYRCRTLATKAGLVNYIRRLSAALRCAALCCRTHGRSNVVTERRPAKTECWEANLLQ